MCSGRVLQKGGGGMTKRLQKGPAGLDQSRGQTRLRPNKAETRQTKRLVIVFYGVQNQMQKRNERAAGEGKYGSEEEQQEKSLSN